MQQGLRTPSLSQLRGTFYVRRASPPPDPDEKTGLGEALASSADRYVPTPFAFVIFAALELAFVFGLLVCTKLEPSQVLKITGGATAISVAGFFGRNAVITIGRRLIAGSEKQ